jgi:hypothetical protein
MIGAKRIRISFSPALPCVDCAELTILGLIYPMSSQMRQSVPLRNEHYEAIRNSVCQTARAS